MEPIQQNQEQPQEAFTLEQLQEEVIKVCRSAHNENVKETRIKEAFAKLEDNRIVVTKITINAEELTGDPNAPDPIMFNIPEVQSKTDADPEDQLGMGQNVVTK